MLNANANAAFKPCPSIFAAIEPLKSLGLVLPATSPSLDSLRCGPGSEVVPQKSMPIASDFSYSSWQGFQICARLKTIHPATYGILQAEKAGSHSPPHDNRFQSVRDRSPAARLAGIALAVIWRFPGGQPYCREASVRAHPETPRLLDGA